MVAKEDVQLEEEMLNMHDLTRERCFVAIKLCNDSKRCEMVTKKEIKE